MSEKNRKTGFSFTWIYVIIAAVLGYMIFSGDNTTLGGGSSKTVTYSQFKQYVEKGYASKIEVNMQENALQMFVEREHIKDVFKNAYIQPGQQYYIEVVIPSTDKLEEFIELQQSQGNFDGEVKYEKESDPSLYLNWY